MTLHFCSRLKINWCKIWVGWSSEKHLHDTASPPNSSGTTDSVHMLTTADMMAPMQNLRNGMEYVISAKGPGHSALTRGGEKKARKKHPAKLLRQQLTVS